MPKGWIQALSGDRGPTHIDFECEDCGPFTAPVQKTNKITKKRLKGTEMYYSTFCPTCRKSCRHDLDRAPPEPVGRKPTKVMKKFGQTIKIHGCDRNVYPADLKEIIEKSNAMFAEQQALRGEEQEDGKEETDSVTEENTVLEDS